LRLWTPSPERIEWANLNTFMGEVRAHWSVAIGDYRALYRWPSSTRRNFGNRFGCLHK
jgi:hypothetical protein